MTSQAHAYGYWKCGGEKVVWDDPFAMVQNTASIPFGSKKEEALDNAIGRWRGVIGMKDMVSMSPAITTLPVIFNDDGQNDIMVAASSTIGGNNGLTLLISDACFWGGDMEWVEADVIVASILDFNEIPEHVLATASGRSTFMHELGHAHGLFHHQLFNNMRTPQPRALVGGPGENLDALPDDAHGGRFLYPTASLETNVFASAFRLNGATDQILLNGTGTFTTCASGGDVLTIPGTIGNNGNVDVTITHRWWVSSKDNAYGGGIHIAKVTNKSLPANKVSTQTVNLNLPALAAGTYFFYHGVDLLDGESRNDDNAVREALKIKVVNC